MNLEGDVLGKYVEKFTRFRPTANGTAVLEAETGSGPSVHEPATDLSMAFLAEHGYL